MPPVVVLNVSLCIHIIFHFFGAFCRFLTFDVAFYTHDNLASLVPANMVNIVNSTYHLIII